MTKRPDYAQTLCALTRVYELGSLHGWTALGGTRNRNFRIETSSGVWLARRRYEAYSSDEQIRFDHGVALHLSERGTTTVPPKRLPGGGTVWCDAGGSSWEVQPFVEGRQLREADPDGVAALAEALARFHEAGEDFTERCDKLGPRGETDPGMLTDKAEQLAAAGPACADAATPYLAWLAWASQELPGGRFAALPATVVHGDVQPANILVKDGKVAAFIDLDWCAWRPRIYDLGFALLFCCADHETPIDGGDIWSLTQPPYLGEETFRRFLERYQQYGRPLTPDESEALPAQIILSWCHTRIMGAFKVPAEHRAAFLARPPRERSDLLPG